MRKLPLNYVAALLSAIVFLFAGGMAFLAEAYVESIVILLIGIGFMLYSIYLLRR